MLSSIFRSPASHRLVQYSTRRHGHSVRLIALEDLPHGKGYEGDVVTVKAGYARNYLIPQKKAVYATPQNFERLDIVDPAEETEAQRAARLERESSMSKKEEDNLKQADLLKKYLKSKVVCTFLYEREGLLDSVTDTLSSSSYGEW